MSNVRRAVIVLLLAASSAVLIAQAPEPTFEVATIKRNDGQTFDLYRCARAAWPQARIVPRPRGCRRHRSHRAAERELIEVSDASLSDLRYRLRGDGDPRLPRAAGEASF